MKKISLILILFLCSCTSVVVPKSFVYQEFKGDKYTLAFWQKKTDTKSPVRIYIEGDGYSFNHVGQPTSNPTPRGGFMRRLAFSDPNPNVVYLARPCQFVKDENCTQQDWTTARFSPDIIKDMGKAVQKIAADQPVILIGYSGGALVSGLIIKKNPKLNVKKWITLAGVLNHGQWTADLNLPPLKDSEDLNELPQVKQHHYIGAEDKTVSADLSKKITRNQNLTIIPNATHTGGFDDYLDEIYD